LLKVWLLVLDNQGQKLVLKTTLSDDEVDDCALSGCFWLVVWVDELGLEEELEV